jgi:tetratricopeptide (TPR) repeat protein
MNRLWLAVVCLSFVIPVHAQDKSYVGQTVLLISARTEYGRRDPKTGDLVVLGILTGLDHKVEGDDGKLVEVRQNGDPVWVRKKSVVLLSDAVGVFTSRIQIRPNSADYNHRAVAWQLRGELDNAVADLNEAVRLDPRDPAAFNNRGSIWDAKKEYDKAIADFNEAIRLNPRDPLPYRNRGGAWGTKQDYDKAIADFTEAVRLNPSDANSLYNRGRAWSEKKEYDQAIADYSAVIQLLPTIATTYCQRAKAWEGKREYQKAVADYDEAIRLDPKDPTAFNGRAWQWATCRNERYRDGKRAVESASQACQLTEWKNPGVIDTLAAAYAEAGQFDEAIRYQEKALTFADYETKYGKEARERLKLFREKQPYREP